MPGDTPETFKQRVAEEFGIAANSFDFILDGQLLKKFEFLPNNKLFIRKKPQCLACGESIDEKDLRVLQPCGHKFHSWCIDDWVQNNGICVCGSPVTSSASTGGRRKRTRTRSRSRSKRNLRSVTTKRRRSKTAKRKKSRSRR